MVNIPMEMLEKVDELLSKEDARFKGYRSRTDVVVAGVKEVLEREGVLAKHRFQHLNTYDDHVKIWDDEMKGVASVYFKRVEGGKVTVQCDMDDLSSICLHVGFALSIPEVQEALERLGLEPMNDERKSW